MTLVFNQRLSKAYNLAMCSFYEWIINQQIERHLMTSGIPFIFPW